MRVIGGRKMDARVKKTRSMREVKGGKAGDVYACVVILSYY